MKMIRLFLYVLMISHLNANEKFDGTDDLDMKDSYKVTGKRSNEGAFKRNKPARSCLDHLKNGEIGAREFTITTEGGPQTVFCDLKSEAGSAWTLVMSHELQYSNKDNIAPFQKPLNMNVPVNEKSPNFFVYRMTLAQMNNIKSHSTHWRFTCGSGFSSYLDYLRARLADFDPLTFIGEGECKKVELINVRGHVGVNVTAAFWQIANKEILHHVSSASRCSFGPSPGFVPNEDNFGFYRNDNRRFKCSSYLRATTNLWFGAYL